MVFLSLFSFTESSTVQQGTADWCHTARIYTELFIPEDTASKKSTGEHCRPLRNDKIQNTIQIEEADKVYGVDVIVQTETVRHTTSSV